MPKLTPLVNVANLQDTTTSQNTLAANNTSITNAFNNTLSLDGSTPNQMQSNLDLNNNQILNLPPPATPNSPLRVGDVIPTGFVQPSLTGDVTASAATGPLTTTVAKIQGTTVSGTTGTGKVVFQTSPSLSTIVNTGTLTLPTSTDTLVGRATTDTLTNKTMVLSGGSNSLSIGGNSLNSSTGTGSVVFSTSPSLTTPTLGAATATTVNGLTIPTTAGTALSTAGQIFGTNPSNPTGTTSAAGVMMGLGTNWKLTPSFSTRALVIINGAMSQATSGNIAEASFYYGTGTAPANGAAVTGTNLSGAFSAVYTASANGASAPFSFIGVVTGLTPGVAYWFDARLLATGGTSASIANLAVWVMEI